MNREEADSGLKSGLDMEPSVPTVPSFCSIYCLFDHGINPSSVRLLKVVEKVFSAVCEYFCCFLMPDPVYKCRVLLRCLHWGEHRESFVFPQPEPWERPGNMSSICPGRCDGAVLSGAFSCVWHGAAWRGTHLLGIQRVVERSVEISKSPGYTVNLQRHKSMLLLKGVKGNGCDKSPAFLP